MLLLLRCLIFDQPANSPKQRVYHNDETAATCEDHWCEAGKQKPEIILQRRATLANTSATVGNTGEAVERRGRAKEASGGTYVR